MPIWKKRTRRASQALAIFAHFSDDVGAIGRYRFPFAQVDVVKGGGVDEGVRLVAVEHGGDGGGVGDVEIGAAGEWDQCVVARGKDAGEVVPELARRCR